MKRALLALLTLLIPGCLAAEPTDDTVQSVGTTCTAWMCGMNSPVISVVGNAVGFHELNLSHIANAEGITLDKMVKNGNAYIPAVINGRLSGTNAQLGTIGSTDLTGAQLWLSQGKAASIVIQVTSVGIVATWAINAAGASPYLETYQLSWAPAFQGQSPPDGWHPLCPLRPDDTDLLGMNAFHSLLFEGERIDGDAKTIGAKLDASWFNIGCAGSTLAKLYLTGHTQAAKAAGFSTEIWQRQAMLKMLSADYCGDGTAMTVAGQPLQWADASDYNKVVVAGSTLEARWKATGVTCLMKPRVEVHPTPLSLTTFAIDPQNPQPADIEAKIASHCGSRPPQCADTSIETDSDYLISANPP